ncbi:MAG: helix-turn-helix transcriptional regulator [Bacteroides sp.]|nr:helix-turn-helix transcriptional regulator [Bacteroides sp.]
MERQVKYREDDKLIDLINSNYSLLMVMSRFGLSLGFGDKSVKEVCQAQGVDCRTFLAVANFLSKEHHVKGECLPTDFALPALMDYLKRAHVYFLDFNLPALRRKLIETIDCSGSDEVATLILKFFDEYAKEVRRHMEYENRSVFTYVEQLLQGHRPSGYDIATFASKHSQVESKLTELKNIIIKYYPGKENNNLLNSVLFDIFNCEQDLATHCQVEDYMFVPAVEHLEQQLQQGFLRPDSKENSDKGDEPEALSQREKEIITCVVKGMTNKAIAEQLFLSIHTVITHRRNIARKLQIHSPAGLTIYAIVNKLVSLEEVKY